MLELIGVMVVIGILLGIAGFSVVKQTKRANRESVANTLQMYATALSEAYYDLGSFKIGATDAETEANFTSWIEIVANEYLTVDLDMGSIEKSGSSFKVTSKTPLDSWEQPYIFWFHASETERPYALIVSGGENGIVDPWDLANDNVGDDIITVVHPKI